VALYKIHAATWHNLRLQKLSGGSLSNIDQYKSRSMVDIANLKHSGNFAEPCFDVRCAKPHTQTNYLLLELLLAKV
jgi:hypothetical protein